MSKLFAWFQKDTVAELEEDKRKLIGKRDLLDMEIECIDKKIAQLKATESKNKD